MHTLKAPFLPSRSQCEVLMAMSSRWTSPLFITVEADLELASIYTFLARMISSGWVEKKGGHHEPSEYRLTGYGKAMQSLLKQQEALWSAHSALL